MVEHLLSKKKLQMMRYAVGSWKVELEKLTAEHRLISLYHRKRWFRKWYMGISVEELLAKYRAMVPIIEALEHDIAEYECKIYLHHVAVDELADDMQALGGIDRTVRLEQLVLNF